MSVREFGENLHRNTRTMSKESLLNLLQSRQNRLPILEDDADILGFLLDNQRDSHKNIMHIGIDGQLDAVERDTHYNARGCTVYRPRYCTAYEILHDNSAAGGLSFPQTNRMFGGGVQYNGSNNVIKLTFPDSIGAEMTLTFWYYLGSDQSPSSQGLFSFNSANANSPFIATNEINKSLLFNAGDNRLVSTSNLIQGWNHIVITAKDGEQKIYVNNNLRNTRYYDYVDYTIYPIYIFGRYYGVAQDATTKLAWLSFCSGIADQTWVTNDYAGKRDFSDASPVEEITTLPFMGDLDPYPNAYDGMLYG